MKKPRALSAGFTLIEVAIVMLVGALVMGSAGTMLNDYLQSSRIALTQNRMQDIDNAIQQYLNVNGVLPCPATLNSPPDSSKFGVSLTDGLAPPVALSYAGDPNDCYNRAGGSGTFKTPGNLPTVAANPANTSNLVIGAVPTRSLNMPDQEMLDAWGNRLVYAVSDYLTVPGNYDPAQGSIALEDGNNNPLVGPVFRPPSYAQYVIVSLGSDRAGAYSLSGSRSVTCPAAPALEAANCNYPTKMFRKSILLGSQKGANYFDDYVTYRSQQANPNNPIPTGMLAPFALGACPTGWTGAGAGIKPPACHPPAGGVCCQKL
jgi:prepilin-type N-terminal cleavage/methylation domain-containing protein